MTIKYMSKVIASGFDAQGIDFSDIVIVHHNNVAYLPSQRNAVESEAEAIYGEVRYPVIPNFSILETVAYVVDDEEATGDKIDFSKCWDQGKASIEEMRELVNFQPFCESKVKTNILNSETTPNFYSDALPEKSVPARSSSKSCEEFEGRIPDELLVTKWEFRSLWTIFKESVTKMFSKKSKQTEK